MTEDGTNAHSGACAESSASDAEGCVDTTQSGSSRRSGERLIITPPPGHVYRITLAESEEDRREMYALRYAEYCQRLGSLSPSDYPNGLEIDAFDPTAVHFVAKHRGSCVVGTTRLVYPVNGRFLMEHGTDAFTVPAGIPRDHTAESSRLIGRLINDSEVGVIHQALLLLQAQCEWSFRSGLKNWLVAAEKKFYERLHRLGWPFIELGPPRTYHNTTSIPVLLEVAKVHAWFLDH